MIRDPMYVLYLRSDEIEFGDYLVASTSIKSLQSLVDFHAKQLDNKKICSQLDYKFDLYKINHNNSNKRLKILNDAKKFNSEVYIDILCNEVIPLFSYNRSNYQDSCHHNNSSVEFIHSDTLYFKENIPTYINDKLNKRQLEHLNKFSWIDISNK